MESPQIEIWQYVVAGLAALAAGMVNALAGGGTLISFPVLTALGIGAVAANVTNTVALVPGYFGATLAQLNDIKAQRERAWIFAPAAVIGGIIGGFLLLNTGEKLFRALVPYLILMASLLLAVSDPVRNWMLKRAGKQGASAASLAMIGAVPVALAAIYGGYFGAGLSVIVLAVLGLFLNDSLTQLNALKQLVAFCTNVAAAVFFLFSGQVVWPVAIVMMVCALIGGNVGGRFAKRIKASQLRMLVVAIGLVVSVIYFIKG